jgi:Zn-dependent protease with chaperone function
MKPADFDQLVTRLERLAAERPSAYRARVVLLALLGYAYVWGALLLVVALLALLVVVLLAVGRAPGVALGIALGLFGLGGTILRSLFVRVPAPTGQPLDRASAPALFAATEELRRRLGAPNLHRVLVTGDFNAAIAQIPRLGVLGWPRNYLVLGLPLMLALSPEQFRGVLAHEFGHLSGAHGRFGAWVYRLRKTWYQLLAALKERRHRGAWLFTRFFDWYAPYFGAYSFVMARAQEYEADRLSASVVGPEQAAEALVAVTLRGGDVEQRFWPQLVRRADREPELPAPFSELPRALRGEAAETVAAYVATDPMAGALRIRTGTADTHPSLADRLAALGQEARALPPLAESAAERFLGATTLAALTDRLDQTWRANAERAWRQRHAYVREAELKLRGLEEKARGEPLASEERWQLAALTGDLRGAEAAAPLYEAVLREQPDHAGASFALGRLLLEERGSEDGIALLERAIAKERELVLPGLQAIHSFLRRQGREEEARPYRARAIEHARELELAREERQVLPFQKVYEPHGLDPTDVEKLLLQLARYEELSRAYLVRRRVEHFPESPLYALGIVPRRPWYLRRSEGRDAALRDRIAAELQFPGETLVVRVVGGNAKLGKLFRKVEGAEIYRA